MSQAISPHYMKVVEELKDLPEDRLVEVEDFIGYLKEKYAAQTLTEPKDFELQEKEVITSPAEERRELEKTGKYSKEFLDQMEKQIAKSSLYSQEDIPLDFLALQEQQGRESWRSFQLPS